MGPAASCARRAGWMGDQEFGPNFFSGWRPGTSNGYGRGEGMGMPDVGLTTATEPLPPGAKVIIKYSVEVEGLPVYQESYDVDQLAKEIESNRERARELWFRRVECAVRCRHGEAFSASLTGCLARPG